MKFYLALDGSKDVDQHKRCDMAARVGRWCMVCQLPANADPDEMSAAELAALKADARPVLDEWLMLLEGLQGAERAKALDALRPFVLNWALQTPAMAGEMRAAICAALSITPEEYAAWLGVKPDAPETPAPDAFERPCVLSGGFPNQPAALGRPPAGEVDRAEIANFYKEYRYVADEKKLDEIKGDADKIKSLAELKELDRERLRIKREMAAYMARKESGASVGEFPQGMDAEKTARLETLVNEWGASESQVYCAHDMDALRSRVVKVLRGWPMRLVSGSMFVDDGRADGQIGDGAKDLILGTAKNAAGEKVTNLTEQFGPPVLMINESGEFLSLLHDYGRVKFNPKQDIDRANYIAPSTLFTNLRRSADVPQWLEIERYPHQPALPGHYYAWRPRVDDYVPTGEMLAKLVNFFDQVKEPHHRALFAAAILTVVWGGKYGKRPFLYFYANAQGSGKSTAAEIIMNMVGGYALLDFSTRGEERLVERILSDQFAGTRCLFGDNLLGRTSSPLLAQIATSSRISGKKLSVGEAWRPNSLCVFLTGNNPQLDRDITVRTFFVKFDPIDSLKKDVGERVDWMDRLNEFIAQNSRHIMADCLAILATARPDVDWTGVTDERNADWAQEVLARVLANPHVRKAVGNVKVQDVLIRNQAYRESVDEELDEALRFKQALLERVCEWCGYGLVAEDIKGTPLLGNYWPREPVFIRASAKEHGADDDSKESRQNITTVWRSTIRGDVNPSWVGRQVNKHIEGGRLPGLTAYRDGVKRGYYLSAEVVVRYLAERAGRDIDSVVEEWRKPEQIASGETREDVTA